MAAVCFYDPQLSGHYGISTRKVVHMKFDTALEAVETTNEVNP